MRVEKKWTITGIIIAAGMIKAIGFPATEASVTKPEKAVAVTTAKREDLTRDITFNAEMKPFQEADLHAKIAGYLKRIDVDIGDQVKTGQVIATLDIDELKDDLARANAAYHDAKLDYDRISAVIKKRPGLLAQEEVDKAYATYEMAKANQQKAKTMLDYATITVPFDGVVTKRYADPGTLIQAGVSSGTQATAVVHIADNTRLRIVFPVPESVVPQIRIGTPVEVYVSSTGQNVKSKIARLAGKIDSSTRTMETEVDIDNPDKRITPGMYASVKVDVERKDAVLSLPLQAVSVGDKPNVWVVNVQHVIEQRPVTLGLQTADKVEVTSGVEEGEKVVFGNRSAVAVGAKVNPKPIDNQRGT